MGQSLGVSRGTVLECTPELRQRIGKNPDSSLTGGLDEEGSQGPDGRVQACGPRANGAWGQRRGAGARDRAAGAGARFFQRSLAASRGVAAAEQRAWRNCVYALIQAMTQQ